MTKTNYNTIPVDQDRLEDIISVLNTGGLLLYPTDTIWGVGCDATNPQAVEKVYALKQRDRSKPCILLVDSVATLKDYVREVHPRVDNLLTYHTRPLTVVYPQAQQLPPISTSADGSVAIRVALGGFCKSLLQAYGKPLISTSANISTEPFPANFGEISSAIIRGVDYVVKAEQYDKTTREPSVIVRVDGEGELEFLRS
ncbi:MAG: L-threonylcarbamoyladenylate synthase [Bacteroidota bacterium]